MKTRSQDWIGRTIVSQYGLVCEVLDASEKEGEVILNCRSLHNNRLWNWPCRDVSLVTRDGEILDIDDGEIYGKIVGKDWELYPDDKCKKISPDDIRMEFGRVRQSW